MRKDFIKRHLFNSKDELDQYVYYRIKRNGIVLSMVQSLSFDSVTISKYNKSNQAKIYRCKSMNCSFINDLLLDIISITDLPRKYYKDWYDYVTWFNYYDNIYEYSQNDYLDLTFSKQVELFNKL